MIVRILLALCVLVPSGVFAQVPQSLTAAPGDQEVSLTWESPQLDEEDTLLCYGVYRDTTAFPDADPGDLSEHRIADADATGSPSYTDTDVRNGVTYYYRVTAETTDEGGTVSCGGPEAEESSFSNQTSATPFAPVDLQLTQPAVSEPAEANSPVEVVVQGTNVPSEEAVRLRYRRGGEASFSSEIMERTDNEFTASIPGNLVTARGIELIVRTKNERGDLVRMPEDGVLSIRVQTETLSFTQPGGTAQTAYRIVAFPTDLNAPRFSSLFEDTFGSYDPTEWRLFSIDENGFSSSEGGYVERNDMSRSFGEGQGIWLISRSGGTVDADGGVSLRTDQPFEIPLQAGWNLIGNPFAFPVPISQLQVENTAGALQDVFGYNGTFVPKGSGDALEPFRGYLVRLSGGQAGTLVIDPTRELSSNATEANQPSSLSWHVDVAARVDRARDVHNTFGVASTARTGIGKHDGREPPPVGDYVSLSFRPTDQNVALWRDVRPSKGILHTWTAEVRTNISGMVTLRATGLQIVPDDQEIWLVDPALDRVQNIRETPTYRFPASGEETTRRVRFLVGSPSAVQRKLGRENSPPQQLELLPSVPHPVWTHATFRYTVPAPTRVTLELFDLLGRRVVTFVDGKRVDAGMQTYDWTVHSEGQALPSGTYLLRLRTREEIRTQRLVVVR